MKKLFVSVGLAASAAGLTSAFAQGLEAAAPKLFNVSGTLRGFYDDNYTSSNTKKDSFGFEVSPKVSANIDLQQTVIGMRYTFGAYYYQDRANNGNNPMDYTHQADFWLDHAFDETMKANVTDSIVIGQDPKLVEGGAVTRVAGNNLANHAKFTLSKEWTRQFSTATHYANNLVIYSDSSTLQNAINPGSNPSQASLLNRIEQNVGTDFQWQFQPETMGFIGYNYSWTRYTGGSQIATPFGGSGGIPYYSDARNNNTHYGYLGVNHVFSPNLSVTAKGGVSVVDLYNDPISTSSSVSPYADVSATYTFMPGSFVQAGFTQNISATDVVTPGSSGQLTQYQQSSVAYMNLTHQFDAKLTGSLIGQYSYSTFKDGAYGGQADNQVSTGVNLNYQINRHFSADLGYNFNELFSNIDGRGYTRNRVYIGLGATY
jgi:hypothetical protein